MSGRRPTPRHAKKGPSRLVVALVSVLLIVLVGLWAWWAYSETARADEANAEKKEERSKTEVPAHKTTHDSMAVTYTYNGEMIRWYVLIDPDNGVQYLVNDRGGCCPRVSYDGDHHGSLGRGCVVRLRS